jgi:lauroyl/myristoyl acyltransferase
MVINLQRINDSPLTIRLISAFCRMLPIRVGRSIANSIARLIASRRDSRLVRAVRSNQWVVRGELPGKEALDQAVLETLRVSAHSIFDLYHFINNPEATRHMIVMEEATQQLLKRPEFDNQGLMLVGLHMSCFDLILQELYRQGLHPMALTIPDPQGGRRLEFERRKKTGMNFVPGSVVAIRQALRHLQLGGMVMTGIDRPIPDPKAFPRFFDRPAMLPMHHIFLAIKAQVPIRVIVANKLEDGKYHVLTSELIEMESTPKWELEAVHNAEKVLRVAERYIRQAPQQWSVPLPVWPETMNRVP